MNTFKIPYLLWLVIFVPSLSVAANPLLEIVTEETVKKAGELQTYKSKANIKMAGLSGETEICFMAPGMIYISLNLGDMMIAQGYDYRTAWLKDQNGQVFELTGSEKRQLVNSAYLAGWSYLLDYRMAGIVEYINDTIIDKTRYSIFTAQPEYGDTIWLFLNDKSKRVEIIREDMDEIPVYTYMSDFRIIDGFEIPFKLKSVASVPQFNSTSEITSFKINVSIDDSLFVKTDESKVDYYFPEESDSMSVPIIYRNGLIYLRAGVNGHQPVYFILDSGSGLTVLDKSYAEDMGLDYQGDFATKGIAGYETAAVAYVDSLLIGGLKLKDQTVGIVDFSELNLKSPTRPLGGLLGYDLLARFPVRIDYTSAEIIFYNPTRFNPPDDRMALDFDFFMKIPVVTAELNGYQGKFLIDLGNALGLILHERFVDKYNLIEDLSDIKDIKGSIKGIGGSSETFAATAKLLKLGAIEVKTPPVLITTGERGVVRSTELDGNIGNMILREFSVTIDYRGKKIYLLPSCN